MKLKLSALLFSSAMMMNALANTAVSASNKIGLKLAAESVKIRAGENTMISPLSLQQALSLVANGTNTSTRTEVEELLGASVEQVNNDSTKLVKDISFSVDQKRKLQAENKYLNPAVVSINNSIWNTNGKTDGRLYVFSPEFTKLSQKHYDATSQSHDFKTQAAADAINSWANEKTYGLVPHIIDLDTLKPMLWVVMNATYMEASWNQAFHKVSHEAPKFTLLNGKKVERNMIRSVQYIRHATLANGTEVAAIAFDSVAGGPELEFVVHLPAAGTNFAEAQQEHFTVEFQESVNHALANRDSLARANVVLPKFSFDTSVEMRKDSDLAKAMDLNFLFQKYADFSLMATAESAESIVGLIKQNSRIELDEKGVKAAAVTLIGGIERTSMPVEPTVSLLVDRPFTFAIVEKNSKSILFLGSVVDPK